MNSKTTLTIATIAIAAAMLAISPMANQAFASFSGSQGRGHTVEETCEGPSGNIKEGDCPGQSEKSDSQSETETTFAGKSRNEKDKDVIEDLP
jgi:hypothetical protein